MNRAVFVIIGFLLAAAAGVARAQIRTNEAVQITISGVPQEDQQQINNTYPVSGNGTVSLPHIGSISAAGSSPEVLARRIEAAYKGGQIFTNCVVNVIANADPRLTQKKITVGGQVRKPGPAQFTEGMTIWEAVQAAGGPTEFGAMNRVELFRGGKVRVLNIKQDQFKHVPVQENDAVNVPQKNMWGQ